ncbi:hypothetical protein [Paraburkholderia aromaticivorans]|uniref:hypothetical protein n=1 Tax=Paraburkholderia aromaticivorans TaxID=2026199 RepID=UPI003D666BD8
MPDGARRERADVLLAPTRGELKVRVFGNVAMVSGVNHYRPASGMNATDYAFTDVYVRRRDAWRAPSSRTTRGAGA